MIINTLNHILFYLLEIKYKVFFVGLGNNEQAYRLQRTGYPSSPFTLSSPSHRRCRDPRADEMRAAAAASFHLAPATKPAHRRGCTTESCSLKPAPTARPPRLRSLAGRAPLVCASLGNRVTASLPFSYAHSLSQICDACPGFALN